MAHWFQEIIIVFYINSWNIIMFYIVLERLHLELECSRVAVY